MSDHRSQDRWGDEELDGRAPRRRGRGALAALFVILVLGGLYVGTAIYVGDRVPASTTVGGVRVGGMDEAEARSALERGTADVRAEPVRVDEHAELVVDDGGDGVHHDALLVVRLWAVPVRRGEDFAPQAEREARAADAGCGCEQAAVGCEMGFS